MAGMDAAVLPWMMLATAVSAVWGLLAWVTAREHARMPRLTGKLPATVDVPLVLAVVPARNESGVVERCLRALGAQQGVELRVVAYDDRSSDDTLRRMEELALQAEPGRLMVVAGKQEPPPGWCGKPHALMQALAAAGFETQRGQSVTGLTPHYLAFVDADVVLRPTALAELAALMLKNSAQLGSALPQLVCKTFWEKVAGPSVAALVTARHRPSRVNNPKDPAVLANGQLLMVTPHAYSAVGGHEGVKNQVLEDVALARAVKGMGKRVVLADGQPVMLTRMYESLGELWEGWGKNAFPLLGGRPGRVMSYAAMALLLGCLPTVCLLAALGLAWGRHSGAAWVAAGWVLPLTVQMGVRKVAHQAWGYAVLAPLGAGVLAALLVQATWRAVTRRPVHWKGRSYVDGTRD